MTPTTVNDLAALLSQVGAHAMVVQYFEGMWRASLRTSSGIAYKVAAEGSALDAINLLVAAMEAGVAIYGPRNAIVNEA